MENPTNVGAGKVTRRKFLKACGWKTNGRHNKDERWTNKKYEDIKELNINGAVACELLNQKKVI